MVMAPRKDAARLISRSLGYVSQTWVPDRSVGESRCEEQSEYEIIAVDETQDEEYGVS